MATFTPKSENWKWFANDAAEPTTQLANENVAPTLTNDNNIIRLRCTIKETGGKTGTMTPLKVRWSATSDGTYVELSGTQPFNYANGAATDAGTTTTFKTTDGTTHGLYHENGTGNEAISASALNEVDIAIVPVKGAAAYANNTNFYFKFYNNNSTAAADTSKTQPQVLTAPFTPKQQNWKFFADDGAEPTSSLAAENTQAPLVNNTNIIRLRTTLAETTGGSSGAVAITVEYSTNDSSFTAMGAGNQWNYANGAATNGNTVTTNKLTDTTGTMKYHEDGSGTETFTANTSYELDLAIVPTGTVIGGQVYYFRFKQAGTEIVLNSGKTHPNILTVVVNTTVIPPTKTATITKYTPTVTASNNITVTPDTKTATITKYVPVVSLSDNQLVVPDTKTVTITKYVPVVSLSDNQLIVPDTKTVTITKYVPTVTASDNITVTPDTKTITITRYIPTVIVPGGGSQVVIPDMFSVIITRYSPTVIVSNNITVIPDTKTATITKYAPIVTASDNKTVIPDTKTVTTASFVPVVTISDNKIVTPNTLATTTTGYAPTVTATTNITVVPDTANITITSYVPNAIIGTVAITATSNIIIKFYPPSIIIGNQARDIFDIDIQQNAINTNYFYKLKKAVG